jgi:inward rectifier potassium channel
MKQQPMRQPSFDPGLTTQFTRPFRRAINRDGTFNVRRNGRTWRDIHPYLFLINMGWPSFMASIFAAYAVVNAIFAGIYCSLGPGEVLGAEATTAAGRFLNMFFFSAHTLSTVGYGSLAPKGVAANVISSVEALIGVLGLAVATGLLFGRISRPSARMGFSENMLVAPYQDISSLQFRVVNRRSNSLMELEARVMLMTVKDENGQPKREFNLLKLEREKVMFLALTWTVVHPIDGESPLWGKTAEDLKRMQAEVMIVIKAYDDTFAQTVLARQSYRYDEVLWGQRFAPAFFVDDDGDIVLELKKVGEVAG